MIEIHRPILRKAYHRKSGSPEMVCDSLKLNGEEVNHTRAAAANGGGSGDATWWVRDDRTGIFYPKGQEKVMEGVPQGAAKDFDTINWLD